MIITRRLFLGIMACLPVAWQVNLGALPLPVPTLHAERVLAARSAWLHTTFDGHGSILVYLRQHYNAAARGLGADSAPTAIILGPQACDQYEREWDDMRPPFIKAAPPPGASLYAFKGVWVYRLDAGWPAWHVGLLVRRPR